MIFFLFPDLVVDIFCWLFVAAKTNGHSDAGSSISSATHPSMPGLDDASSSSGQSDYIGPIYNSLSSSIASDSDDDRVFDQLVIPPMPLGPQVAIILRKLNTLTNTVAIHEADINDHTLALRELDEAEAARRYKRARY